MKKDTPKGRTSQARPRSSGRALSSAQARRLDAHPVTDLEEAESVLDDLPGAAENPSSGRKKKQLDTLRRESSAWSAERDLQTFHGLACLLTADLDIRSLVRQIIESGVQTLGAERGILFLGRGDGGALVPVMAINIEGEELLTLERVSRTILRSAQKGEVILTQDAMSDPRLRAVESVQLNQMRSILCTSLVAQTGSVGAIYLDAPAAQTFHPGSEAILKAFADVAARALENARLYGELLQENVRLRERPAIADPFQRFVGASPAADNLRRRARVIALMDGACLIRGERGSGRTLLARAIHEESARAARPFLACDCSMIPFEELKGLIFGRTGVAAAHGHTEERGLLARADRGTLYLAGAESLGVDLENELAAVITRGVFRAMGARKDSRLDVRLILSTSKNLDEEVRHRRFSANLYVKVRLFTLQVPSLRERPEEIEELAAHFLKLHGESQMGSRATTLTPEALQLLEAQTWPGNVGELEQVIRRALLLTTKNFLDAPQIERALLPMSDEEARAQGPWSGLILPLDEWEKEAIRRALAQVRGNKAKASRMLGIHRNTLLRKLAAWKL